MLSIDEVLDLTRNGEIAWKKVRVVGFPGWVPKAYEAEHQRHKLTLKRFSSDNTGFSQHSYFLEIVRGGDKQEFKFHSHQNDFGGQSRSLSGGNKKVKEIFELLESRT